MTRRAQGYPDTREAVWPRWRGLMPVCAVRCQVSGLRRYCLCHTWFCHTSLIINVSYICGTQHTSFCPAAATSWHWGMNMMQIVLAIFLRTWRPSALRTQQNPPNFLQKGLVRTCHRLHIKQLEVTSERICNIKPWNRKAERSRVLEISCRHQRHGCTT